MTNIELKEMYANLLANSMLSFTKYGVHPAFVEIIKVPELEDEFGFITPVMMEGDYDTRAARFGDQILHMIRIQD